MSEFFNEIIASINETSEAAKNNELGWISRARIAVQHYQRIKQRLSDSLSMHRCRIRSLKVKL